MRAHSPFLWSLVAAALTLAAPSCKTEPAGDPTGNDENTAGGDTGNAVADKAEKPARKFVYVSPDPIGVNPFLTMGKTGIEAAGKKHGAEVKTFQSEDPTTRKENVRAAVAGGATVVAVLGFQFNDIVIEFAKKHPGVHFLIVDQCVDERPDNLHCAVFREYESTFLLGAAAASLSETNRVGVVCALDIPFMHRFTDGFAQGAKHIKPDIEVDVRWVGGQNPFADPVRAKELALAIHSAGADIIFAATSGGDYGVFEAAAEKEFRVMGVDINHCRSAPGRVIDSALKKLDVAMVDAIDKIMAGDKKVTGSYGLKEGGGGLTALQGGDLAATGCLIAEKPELVGTLSELRDELVSGAIALGDPMFAGKK